MIDPSPHDLNFGHFGAPNYSLDNSSWAFTRDPRRHEVSFVTPWSTISHAAIRHATPGLSRYARHVHKAVREVARDYPDLTPATDHLVDDEMVSAASIYASGTYDATIGSLLAFGSITCKGSPDHRPKPITATATGEVGNILQLQVVERVIYGTDGGAHLEGPLLAHGERGYWNEEAAPIRQICFANGEESSTFLAVRLPQRTVLFHPAYVHDRNTPHSSRYFDLPTTRVDVAPIFSIPNDATGGSPHADVAFNPSYQRQFAIVDELGQWSVWDIDDGYRATKFSVNLSIAASSTSQLTGDARLEAQPNGALGDGWARIFWCGDANTIVIASRRAVSVVSVKDGLTALKSPEFISVRSADWILDIQKHPSIHNHFFVLTSTRIFLVEVTGLVDDPSFTQMNSGAVILLSWTHFRGTNDITLQFSIHRSDEESIILLYSRLNKLITVYCLEKSRPVTDSRWFASDPVSFVIEGLAGAARPHHLIRLHQEDLQYKGVGTEAAAAGLDYHTHSMRFFQLTAMLSDLSIHHIVFTISTEGRASNTPMGPITWSRASKRQHCHPKNLLDGATIEADFLVPDGPLGVTEARLKRPHQPPRLVDRQSISLARHVLDFRSLYKTLLEATKPPTSITDANSEFVDLSLVIQEMEMLLSDATPSGEPLLGTLLEFAGKKILVSDVDESSIALFESYNMARPQQELAWQNIASGYVLGLADGQSDDPLNIASIYDSILQCWIAPLPRDISVRVRQRDERIARRIAAETLLAASWIRPSAPSHHPHVKSQSSYSQASAVASPRLQSQQLHLVSSSSLLSSSLPDEDHDGAQPSATVPTAAHPLHQLSRHLRIEDRVQPKPVSTGISRLLSHWQPGTDPKTYTWEDAEDDVDKDTQDDEESQELRRKEERRRKRREKRQQTENERFQAAAVSQVQVLKPQVPRSSPGPVFGTGVGLGMSSQVPTTSQSQSQDLGGFIVQSQIEPGKHGGRPVAKKKKGKKRVGGF